MSIFRRGKAARRALLAGGVLVIASAAISGIAATAASAKPPQVPPVNAGAQLPDPVAVTVSHTTTAYLVLDLTTAVCTSSACLATLPAAAALLSEARANNALVIYSKTSTGTILPQVAPLATDPVVQAHADKFFGTNLAMILSAHPDITTLVIVGSAANGAVLYTTFEANLRGYNVVVAEDGVSASTPYVLHYSFFQFLNEPGFSNPTNAPLAKGVTLSESDLITFT